MKEPQDANVRLALPKSRTYDEGVTYVKHPPFDEKKTLLGNFVLKIFLIVIPDAPGFWKLVGIRLSLTSAKALAGKYDGAVVHRFLGTK